MAHGDAREGKWRGNWRMERVASTLHTTSEQGVSSITTADARTSTASSRLNWRPRWFKWTRSFRRKKNCCFCACAITFQTQSTTVCCLEFAWTSFLCTRVGRRSGMLLLYLFGDYWTTLLFAETAWVWIVDWSVNSVLERTWKEADVTYFGAWSRNWPEVAEVDYEHVSLTFSK